VARILGVSPQRVRALVRGGICSPTRDGRRLEFSFQDIILLRTAVGLLQAKVPARRVRAALRQLTRQMEGRPLTGARVYADGRNVVVRMGRQAWQADSGQGVFVFEVDDLARRSTAVVPVRARRPHKEKKRPTCVTATDWFEQALALEETDPAEAEESYQKAIALDPQMSDAYLNLGRLVHEKGKPKEAIRLYQRAIKTAPGDAIAYYNMAMALEDIGDLEGAAASYHHALELEGDFADAHFNLGRLLEILGRREHALRHLLAYRKLTGGR
jgi:predicted Zn-dependent protease